MRWDDPSLASVLGACLPMENEPLIIVRYKDADLILNLMYKKSRIVPTDSVPETGKFCLHCPNVQGIKLFENVNSVNDRFTKLH